MYKIGKEYVEIYRIEMTRRYASLSVWRLCAVMDIEDYERKLF